MALGAKGRDVLGLILRQHLVPAVAGVAVGIVGAIAVSRFIKSLVYGVGPTDVVTFAGVAVLLVAVAGVAAYIPARRATRVDPLVALRAE